MATEFTRSPEEETSFSARKRTDKSTAEFSGLLDMLVASGRKHVTWSLRRVFLEYGDAMYDRGQADAVRDREKQ